MPSKISIIIPIHNASCHLRSCLNSILSQSYKNYEVLMIDDGSKDESFKICKEFAQLDTRFKYYYKKNEGVSSARNVGLQNSTGEWIYFIDADDELYAGALDSLIGGITENIDLIIGSYTIISDDNNQEERDYVLKNQILDSESAIREQLANTIYLGYPWIKLFRASVIRQNRILFDENIFYNEDRLFTIAFIIKSSQYTRYLSDKVYKYFLRASGAISQLQSSFNYKSLTEFFAYERMASLLSKTNMKQNYILSRECLTINYIKSVRRMRKYKISNKSLEKQMRNCLSKHATCVFIIKTCFLQLSKSVLRKVRQHRMFVNEFFSPII